MKTKFIPVDVSELEINSIYFDTDTLIAVKMIYKGKHSNSLIFEVVGTHRYKVLTKKDCIGINLHYKSNLVAFKNIESPFFKINYINT